MLDMARDYAELGGMSHEIKVGLLLLAALAVLAWMSVASGTIGFGRDEEMREFRTVFTDVEGIKVDSPVKMAGVDVGKVIRVELQPDGTAVLRFHVRQSVALPANVAAQVTTSGLIGERFVALVPGRDASQQGGVLAQDVTVLPAVATTDPASITADFAKVASDMESVTIMLKQVLGNPENAQKLQGMIDTMAAFSDELKDANTAGAIRDLGVATHNLAKISEDLKQGHSVLGQLLVNRPSGTTPDMAVTLQELQAAVRDFRQIMDKINSGQGTIGRLVNDESTANKLDDTLDSVNGLTGGLKGWVGGGDEVSGTVGPTSRTGGFGAELMIESVGVLGEDSVLKGSAQARIRAGDNFVDLGIQGDGFAAKAEGSDNIGGAYYGKDFGEEWKYSAQVGRMVTDDVALRAGLKHSTAGVGADMYGRVPFADKRVRYSADFYDWTGQNTPGSEPHLDVTARADLTRRVYGVVGYDNVMNGDYGGPMVGIGLKLGDAAPAPGKYVARKDL